MPANAPTVSVVPTTDGAGFTCTVTSTQTEIITNAQMITFIQSLPLPAPAPVPPPPTATTPTTPPATTAPSTTTA